MDILESLFDSSARVKLMRLFIGNPEYVFATKEVSKRSKVPVAKLRKELNLLKNAKLVKQKQTLYDNRKVKGWYLNPDFPLLHPLSLLLAGERSHITRKLSNLFKDAGRMRLIVASGVFLGRDDTRADLLVVGDKLKLSKIEGIIKKLEADLGKELIYAVCDTQEFIYRLNAYDKFIHDILDYPHEKVFDKMGVY